MQSLYLNFLGRSTFKQYNPAKPHKWGMKMFTRASSSGVIYDFALYVGDGTCPSYGLGISSDIVLYLASSLPKFQNYKLYFDNWFTSVSLLISLKEMGIFCIGTVRKNRMGNCELQSESDLKKLGRGSYDMKCEINHGISTVRWLDNKAVQLVSTYIADEPIATCRRWSSKEKKFIDIARPAIVSEYNKHMGGVDLSDMLMELYKINHRSAKWYMRIFYWALGTSVTNSWLLYRKHLKMVEPKAKHMPLIKFQMDIANELLNAGPPSSVQKKRGRPSANILEKEEASSAPSSPSSSAPSSSSKRRIINHDPPNSKRYDESGHWLVWGGKGRCRLCKTGTPLSKCIKCGVHLCCNTSKNCFLSYHT